MSFDPEDTPGLRGFIKNSPDAFLTVNIDSQKIVGASKAAEEFFGYSQEELQSMDISDLHPPDETERYEQLFLEHVEKGPSVISQFEDGSPVLAVTADGEQIPVEINSWFVEDESEEKTLFQGVFRDISERLERRRQLHRQKARLEEFSSVVAHDLRNPLNVAQGRATLVQQDCESDHVDKLKSALNRMETIIEDTLILAQSGRSVGEMRRVNIMNTLGNCWEMVEAPDATLDVADNVTIRADPDRLKHICENLIRNAVEHAGDAVTISLGQKDENTIYFEDDGPGIPKEKRDTVFEPGYSSTTDGTGMGLPIVKRLAEAHGWTVSLTESSAGGARFEFSDVAIME